MRVGFKRISAPSGGSEPVAALKHPTLPSIIAKTARINRIQRSIEKCEKLLSDIEYFSQNIHFKLEKYDVHEKLLELTSKNEEISENIKELQTQNNETEQQLIQIEEETKNIEEEEKSTNNEYLKLKSENEEISNNIRNKKAKGLQIIFELELLVKQRNNLLPKYNELDNISKEIQMIYSKTQSKKHEINDSLENNHKQYKKLLYCLSSKRAILYHLEQDINNNITSVENNKNEIDQIMCDIQTYDQKNSHLQNCTNEQIQILRNTTEENSRIDGSIFGIQIDIKEVKKQISEKQEMNRQYSEKLTNLETMIQQYTDDTAKMNDDILEIHENTENINKEMEYNPQKNEEILNHIQEEAENMNKEISSLNQDLQNIKLIKEKQLDEINHLTNTLNEILKENHNVSESVSPHAKTNGMRKIKKKTFMKVDW